jgi:hypothetical protein
MLCILFFIFYSCTLPTRLHLDWQYSAKIPLLMYVEAKGPSFFCSTAGLVVEEPKSQEYNQTHKVCSAGAKGYMV